MSIYLRGSTWWYCITMDGKTYRSSCGTQNKKLAKEYHDTKKAQLWRQHRLGEKPRRTWKEASERWLKSIESNRSYDLSKTHIDWWTEQFKEKGMEYLDQITPENVAEIRDEEFLRKKQRGGGSQKPATVNRKIASLRAVMNAACRKWLWLDRSPLFEMLPESNERVRWLTPEEVERVVKALPEPYCQMAMLAVTTGLRRANVMGLRWEWVNMVDRTISLPAEVVKNDDALKIPLGEIAAEIIRGQIGKHSHLVFPRWDGEEIREIPSSIWARACKTAGIKDFRWHDFRHTWASLLRQNHVGLDRLKELGGWKDGKMVERYAHLSVAHLAPHAAVLDRVLVQNLHKAA